MWEGVSLYMCVCEVRVSLSHVLVTDTQVHLSVCLYDCRTLRTRGKGLRG